MATSDNISGKIARVSAAVIAENGAGTYNFDVFVPAGAMILDVIVHNEVLWTAATSATLMVGDFAVSTTYADGGGSPYIGAAIDADGFIAATSLKATDLLAGESINLDKQGGLGGAYSVIGTSTHVGERVSLVDRFVRFNIVSVGAGTAGRTYCALLLARPTDMATITQ